MDMVPRVKRIIFDEVHCIGQAEDGLIWEQLLLLAPCPIIVLSATIGNPTKFRDWLEITQRANGLEIKIIEHKTRYSDLREYVYRPPEKFVFNGLSSGPQLAPLGLNASPSMAFLHPGHSRRSYLAASRLPDAVEVNVQALYRSVSC
jgi:superfamily II RNA helicase